MGDQKFLRFIEQLERQRREFWQREYPAMSRPQRVKYWLSSTHHGMRTQGEATGDEYSEFSPRWYARARQAEPDFDAIFREAVAGLGFAFDRAEYQRRIGGGAGG